MKKQIAIIFIMGAFLVSFALLPAFQNGMQLDTSNSITSELNIDEKLEITIQSNLGWEIDEVRTIYVTCSDPSDNPDNWYTEVRCKAITENVIILIEEALESQKSYSYCQGFAERFQRDAYDPIAQYIGVPRTSPVDNSSNVAIIFADLHDHTSGVFSYVSLGINGFESIQSIMAGAYELIVHEYQHAVHHNYRGIVGEKERWFNEGMSETLPPMFGFSTSNETNAFHHFTGEEGGGITGPNIPLLYWDHGNDYGFVRSNYGAAFAFSFYLYEHYGAAFLGDILKLTGNNMTYSVDLALTMNGFDKTFKDVLVDWALAVQLDDPQLNPLWNYEWLNVNAQYENLNSAPSESSLPVTFNGKVFESAASTYTFNIRADSLNALKYDFDGTVPGEFHVFLVANEYVNISHTKKYMSELIIDSTTQNGSGFIMLPNNAMNVDLIVVNTHYKFIESPEYLMDIEDSTNLDSLREEFTCEVTAFDPGLIGTIDSLTYDNRTFHIEAVLDWDLEESLEDYGMSPHVVLYDADGEFAFNLQSYLIYDEASDKWVGDLVITEDIKAGIYQIKLFMQGSELDSEEGKVSAASGAPGFLLLPSFLAVLVITIKRRNKN